MARGVARRRTRPAGTGAGRSARPSARRPAAAGTATKSGEPEGEAEGRASPGYRRARPASDMLGSAAVASAMPNTPERELHHAVGVVRGTRRARRQQRRQQRVDEHGELHRGQAEHHGHQPPADARHRRMPPLRARDEGQAEPAQLRQLDEELAEATHEDADGEGEHRRVEAAGEKPHAADHAQVEHGRARAPAVKKRRWVLRAPAARAASPTRRRYGNRIRVSRTARSTRRRVGHPARRHHRDDRGREQHPREQVVTRQAQACRPGHRADACGRTPPDCRGPGSSVKTGMTAVDSAPSARSRRSRFGMRNATKNASVTGPAPNAPRHAPCPARSRARGSPGWRGRWPRPPRPRARGSRCGRQLTAGSPWPDGTHVLDTPGGRPVPSGVASHLDQTGGTAVGQHPFRDQADEAEREAAGPEPRHSQQGAVRDQERAGVAPGRGRGGQVDRAAPPFAPSTRPSPAASFTATRPPGRSRPWRGSSAGWPSAVHAAQAEPSPPPAVTPPRPARRRPPGRAASPRHRFTTSPAPRRRSSRTPCSRRRRARRRQEIADVVVGQPGHDHRGEAARAPRP